MRARSYPARGRRLILVRASLTGGFRRMALLVAFVTLASFMLPMPGASTTAEAVPAALPRPGHAVRSNAAAIQPAIDAARDAGGGSVYLPGAVYLLAEKVRVHSNVTVFGDGIDRTILRWAPGATLDHMMSNGGLTAGNSKPSDLEPDARWARASRAADRTAALACASTTSRTASWSSTWRPMAKQQGRHLHLGYNKTNGAINVRVSGCRATNNARNGVSLVHGSGDVIDHCQVSSNNRGEPVAGIDVEPDQDLSVTSSKLVGNTANGQNVGIQLFVQFTGYATISGNAICQNSASGNQSAMVSTIKKGSANYFVDNSASSNGTSTSWSWIQATWWARNMAASVEKLQAAPSARPRASEAPPPTSTPTPRPDSHPDAAAVARLPATTRRSPSRRRP